MPDGPSHPVGTSGADLVVRRECAIGALSRASVIVDALEAEVTSRGLLALFTDADGIIVRARGGSSFRDEIVRTRLIEGARWDEASRGTNAIGTAIAERCAIAVVGRAHFESTNHGLFCYASPIFGPNGDLTAILDVSGPLALDHYAVGATVARAAAEIEETLRASAYATSGPSTRRLVERMIERTKTPAILLEPPGIVRRLNAAASAELELAGPTNVERLFGISWTSLVREASAGSAVFETARRRFEVHFESIVAASGSTIGIVCFFDHAPRGGRARRAPVSSAAILPPCFDPIVATDNGVIEAKRRASKLAPADLPILLLAETGTGKELFARAIHAASRRSNEPLVSINCGALTGSLLESELFGYAPGAFTGASRSGVEGKLAAAHRGTLFLDEIAEMPASAQAMLLRFLEDGSYCRIGEAHPRHADVRIVAATCRDLPSYVTDGRFRSDLFYRIHGGSVRLPALRDRSDRLELARALLLSAATEQGLTPLPELAPSAEAWILDHSWPGNVRELKTAIKHALAVSSTRELRVEDFPEPLITPLPARPLDGRRDRALREMAITAVETARGNVSEAARALGVARSTVYRMLGRRRTAD